MKILLDNEDVFYIAMDLSKGGGEPVDTMDAIEAGAKVQLKKVVEWLEARKKWPCDYCAYEYRIDGEDVEALLKEVEVCPKCNKEPHLCKCPTINRGSFAKYVEVEDD